MGEGAKMGRPTLYSQELADKICDQIATSSKSMKTICAELNMKVSTVLCWLSEGHPEFKPDFLKQYARAKEMQADFMAEEIIEIADDGSNDFMTIVKGDQEYEVENKEVTNRSKLRVDARKWIASKLKPKKYGEKTDITSDGKAINQPFDHSKLTNEELMQLVELKRKASGQ